MGDRGSGALWREGRLWGNSRGTAIGSHRPPRAANNMVKGAAGTAKLFGPMAPAHSKGTPRAGGVSCGRVATIEGVEFASDSLLEGLDSNFPYRAEIGLGFRLPDDHRCATARCPGADAGSPSGAPPFPSGLGVLAEGEVGRLVVPSSVRAPIKFTVTTRLRR